MYKEVDGSEEPSLYEKTIDALLSAVMPVPLLAGFGSIRQESAAFTIKLYSVAQTSSQANPESLSGPVHYSPFLLHRGPQIFPHASFQPFTRR